MVATSTQTAHSKQATYIPALDGLRAVAILLVILSHYGFAFMPGGFGVTLFFFISGFLITRLLLKELEQHGKIELGNFYIRRLLRLYPALLFLIGLAVAYAAVSDCTLDRGYLMAALLYYENYYTSYINGNLVGNGLCPRFFLVLWSLAVEEHFYLAYPLLVGLLWRRVRLLLVVMALICVGSLLRRIDIFLSTDDVEWAFGAANGLTDARLDSIMYGCMVAVVLNIDSRNTLVRLVGKPWVFTLACLVLVLSVALKDQNDFYRVAWQFTVQSLAMSVVVPAVLFHPAYERLRSWLSRPAMLYVGRLSYSLYLFHWFGICVAFDFLQILLRVFDLGQPSFWRIVAVGVPLGLATTLFSYYGIERPMVALRKRFGSAGI